MNPNTVHNIVKETLDNVPYKFSVNKNEWILVGLTFSHETNFYNNVLNRDHVGMMGMNFTELKWFIKDHLQPDLQINEYIYETTMVDLSNFEWADIEAACYYNIAFQVIITYMWYYIKCNRPESVEESIQYYIDSWPSSTKKSRETVRRALMEYMNGMKEVSFKDLE